MPAEPHVHNPASRTASRRVTMMASCILVTYQGWGGGVYDHASQCVIPYSRHQVMGVHELGTRAHAHVHTRGHECVFRQTGRLNWHDARTKPQRV